MKKNIVFLFGLAVAFSFSMAIDGCGKKGNAELTKVRLLLDWKPGSEHAFLYLGQQKGFFKERGIDLEIIAGEGSSTSVNMVSTGNAEFALASGEAALQGRSADQPRMIKVIAEFFPTTPTVIYSLEKKKILLPKDLYGKKVGVMKGSSAYKHYQAFIVAQHLDHKKIEEIPTSGSLQEVIAGNSELDAMVHFAYQHPLQLGLQGYHINEIKIKDYGVEVYGMGLISQEKYLSQHQDVVKKVVAAVLKSLSYTIDHPQEALTVFANKFPEQDSVYAFAKLEWVNKFIKDGMISEKPLGYQTQEKWENTQQYLLDQKLIVTKYNLNDFYTNEFLK